MANKTAGYVATVLSIVFMLFSIALIMNTRTNAITGFAISEETTTLNESNNNSNAQKPYLDTGEKIIQRDIQVVLASNEIYGITLLMKDSIINEKSRIEETLPQGAEILEWNVIGAIESMSDIFYSHAEGNATWEFNASRQSPILSYKLRLPKNSEAAKLEATYYVKGATMGITRDYVKKEMLMPTTQQQVQQQNNEQNVQTNTPAIVSFNSPDYPLATVLALGSVILILIIAILLVGMRKEGSKLHSRKDLHLMIHNAMQTTDKDELKSRYIEVLKEYNSKGEQEKHEYYDEVALLYDAVIKSK